MEWKPLKPTLYKAWPERDNVVHVVVQGVVHVVAVTLEVDLSGECGHRLRETRKETSEIGAHHRIISQHVGDVFGDVGDVAGVEVYFFASLNLSFFIFFSLLSLFSEL